MVDTIITAAIGDVVSRVISLLLGRLIKQQSTEAKFATLRHMLIRICSVVEEAKGRQIFNHGTLQWLSELIDIEYQGRYLLDTIWCDNNNNEEDQHGKVPHASTPSLLNPAKRVRVARSTSTMIRRGLPSWNHGLDVYEIDRVQERMRDVCDDLREFIMLLQSCQPISRPLYTNIFRDGQMFSRHVEKESIINFLLCSSGSSTGKIEVLPIIGNNGVGKTTLVQHACDDARVRNRFDLIALCTILTNGGTPVLQSKHSIGGPGINISDPSQLFKNCLHDKRFLMVLEDVDMSKMLILEGLLPSVRCSKEGSRIIITTNSLHVTAIGTVKPIELKTLPLPEYWFFFKNHAFPGRDVEDNPRLVAAGKAIAMKLNGSFFGAKILGSLLRERPDPNFWYMVLRNNIADLSVPGDGIAYVWDLADNLLPNHVKMCKTTVHNTPVPYQTPGLARLQDLCIAAPHSSKITCWIDRARFEEVLMCKSVLPFYNAYHIARCVCTCAVDSPNYVIQM